MRQVYGAAKPAGTDARRGLAAYVAPISERRRFRQARGRLPSEKMRAPVSFTSDRQMEAMMVLELRHSVVAYEAWPVEVSVRAGSEWFPYHPSLGVTLSNGRKLAIDLFREEDGTPAERAAFEAALAPELDAAGYILRRTGERNVRHDPSLANVRHMLRSSGCPVDARAEYECVRRLSDMGGAVTLDTLSGGDDLLFARACVLAMRRVLAVDLGGPTPGQCVVQVAAALA